MPFALSKTEKRTRLSKLNLADGRHSAEPQSASSQPAQPKPSLGADLKAARSEKSISLNQVSQDTHISLRHLQNLEEGHYADLPGGMYNRAFLRSYCAYLGLAPAEFLERFEKEFATHGEKLVKAKARSQPMPSQPLRVPPLLVWSVMLLVSVAGLYMSRSWIALVFSPYFSHPPASRLSHVAPGMPPPQAIATQPVSPAPTASAPVPQQISTDAAAAPKENVQPADEPERGTIRLQFEVVQQCWMSLTSDGNRVASRTLQAGESLIFDAKEHFVMVLGNAGGVRLKINGTPAKPLGAPGAVVKLLINMQTIPDLLQKLAG